VVTHVGIWKGRVSGSHPRHCRLHKCVARFVSDSWVSRYCIPGLARGYCDIYMWCLIAVNLLVKFDSVCGCSSKLLVFTQTAVFTTHTDTPTATEASEWWLLVPVTRPVMRPLISAASAARWSSDTWNICMAEKCVCLYIGYKCWQAFGTYITT